MIPLCPRCHIFMELIWRVAKPNGQYSEEWKCPKCTVNIKVPVVNLSLTQKLSLAFKYFRQLTGVLLSI